MILDEICTHKREEVAQRKAAVPLKDLEEGLEQARPARDFRAALRKEGISLIAEIKKASPTKGVLIENVDPVELAAVYESSGARALSVLTDGKYFSGALDDLVTARQGVKLPCLRKDFVVDEYQIYESRLYSADAILLIVAVLSDRQLEDYLGLAGTLGLATLVETHTAGEIERALRAEAHIIGINNRDLNTFEVNVKTTLELKKLVPGGNVLVSESGIRTRDHVRQLEDGGVDAILVGEALVTSGNIPAAIAGLLGHDES